MKMLDVKNIYIVASTFYDELTNELIKGAKDVIMPSKNDDSMITVVKVPGAFEIPGMVNQILKNKKPSLIITLGVIIKGQTNHLNKFLILYLILFQNYRYLLIVNCVRCYFCIKL